MQIPNKRTITNKCLLGAYIILVLVIPMIALIVSYSVYDDLAIQKTLIGRISVFLYVLVSLPVYLIYSRLVIKEYFPYSNKQAILLFVPFIISYASFFIDKGFNGVWNYLIINSLPLYVGLNLVFFVGLVYLLYDKNKDEDVKSLLGILLASLVILCLLFLPVLHFFLLGIEINSMNLSGYQMARSVVIFIFTILLMAFFHYKIVIRLYEKGEL